MTRNRAFWLLSAATTIYLLLIIPSVKFSSFFFYVLAKEWSVQSMMVSATFLSIPVLIICGALIPWIMYVRSNYKQAVYATGIPLISLVLLSITIVALSISPL